MPENVTGPDIADHRGEEVQHDFSRKAIVAVYINTSLDSSTALEVHTNFFDVDRGDWNFNSSCPMLVHCLKEWVPQRENLVVGCSTKTQIGSL